MTFLDAKWREDREETMKRWDYWRRKIAEGFGGSAPRDWLESELDCRDERIAELEKRIAELETMLAEVGGVSTDPRVRLRQRGFDPDQV